MALIIRKPSLYVQRNLFWITSDDAIQLDIFHSEPENIEKSKKLMQALDGITTKYGMEAVKLACQDNVKPPLNLTNFQPLKNETTNINDIITVK